MKLPDMIVRAGLIGIGIALLWVFSCILRYGSHIVQEPSRPILIIEIIFVTIIVVMASVNLIRDMMNERTKGRR